MPNDKPEEIGARGILYLLIFQQLGQLLRWSWGYNVLLAPADKYLEEDGGTCPSGRVEQGPGQYRDDPQDDSDQSLLDGYGDYDTEAEDDAETRVANSSSGSTSPILKAPITPAARGSISSSRSSSSTRRNYTINPPQVFPAPANGNLLPIKNNSMTLFPNVESSEEGKETHGIQALSYRTGQFFRQTSNMFKSHLSQISQRTSAFLPKPLRWLLAKLFRGISRFVNGLWEFMNPPLWAMLVAVFVACVPSLQHLFFAEDTFIQNSVTRAVDQSAGVAVPLILVVLGGNLARYDLLSPFRLVAQFPH